VSDRLVPLGEIVATHGLEGWLKLNPFNPKTVALQSAREVFIERDGVRWPHQLEANQPHHRQILVKFQGIDTIEAAKALVGTNLSVAETCLPALQPGEYYHFQVMGLEVFDSKGNPLGTISGTLFIGGREIYVVTGRGKEYLIPAVKEIIDKIDFDAGKMIITPPEGLLEL
jgi:16S rRNA processing protein RimM